MNLYLRILLSTLLGWFGFSCLIAVGFIINGNVNATLALISVVTIVGFLGYGLIGSAIWYFTYRMVPVESREFGHHIRSAVLGVLGFQSVAISFAWVGWARYPEVFVGFILSCLGAILSLVAYRIVFYRNEDGRSENT